MIPAAGVDGAEAVGAGVLAAEILLLLLTLTLALVLVLLLSSGDLTQEAVILLHSESTESLSPSRDTLGCIHIFLLELRHTAKVLFSSPKH